MEMDEKKDTKDGKWNDSLETKRTPSSVCTEIDVTPSQISPITSDMSQLFTPDIYGPNNPNYQVDYTEDPKCCRDHDMMGTIWLSCEQAADQAGYGAFVMLGKPYNRDKYTRVFVEAREAYVRRIPRPEDIIFTELPSSYRMSFVKLLENNAEEYADEVMVHIMLMR